VAEDPAALGHGGEPPLGRRDESRLARRDESPLGRGDESRLGRRGGPAPAPPGVGDQPPRLRFVRRGQTRAGHWRRSVRVRIPDQRHAARQAGELGSDRAGRGDTATVVGDQHAARPADRAARPAGERAGPCGGPTVVHAQQRASVAADPDLHGRGALQPEVDDLDAGGGEQVAQQAPLLVGRDRGHQHHLPVAVAGRQGGGQAGAAGAVLAPRVLDDRDRTLRRQAIHPPVEVAVEQRVAHHHQRTALPTHERHRLPATVTPSTAAWRRASVRE
jgi:hypothetical protein